MEVPVKKLPVDERTNQVREEFERLFGRLPEFYVRVPGRVNLIGEHIDYCGYGVCPMALAQDIFLAVCTSEDKELQLNNLEKGYPSFKTTISPDLEISVSAGGPEWYQYFLCGLKGVLEVAPEGEVRGMRVLVSGSVPRSAGLSSSSALVGAAALATSYALNIKLSKEKLASLCAECERYIGTQGGGMDQAIAFLANEGCAKLIEFSPLRSKDVVLPEGAVFVIAHSLTNLNKAATADYNCRVVECRLAAQIIAKRKGLKWQEVRKLGELQAKLGVNLQDILKVVEEVLTEDKYSKQDVVQELGTTSEDLDEISLTPNTKHIENFKLRQRALHVFKEAERVELFYEACRGQPSPNTLETLGKLMNDSHDSLRDLYECSHPQLDQLVEVSREVALGVRLTGAGWGGCAVALIPPGDVDRYVRILEHKFYKPLGYQDDLGKVVFPTGPKGGACIYKQ